MKQQLPDRLLEARKKKGLSQQELAKVYFTNVGKYERGEATPAADILNRIAKALEVSPDYLLNGTLQDKSADAITDEELLAQFRRIEKLHADKKSSLKSSSIPLSLKPIYKNNWHHKVKKPQQEPQLYHKLLHCQEGLTAYSHLLNASLRASAIS